MAHVLMVLSGARVWTLKDGTEHLDEISLSISGGTDPLSAKKLKSRLAELSDVLENPADLHEQNEEACEDSGRGLGGAGLTSGPMWAARPPTKNLHRQAARAKSAKRWSL